MNFKLPEPTAYLYHDASSLVVLLSNERQGWCVNSTLMTIKRRRECANETPLYTEDQLKQALRDVLEEAAKFCADNQVARSPTGGRSFTPFAKENYGIHEGMDYADAIRTIIGEIN